MNRVSAALKVLTTGAQIVETKSTAIAPLQPNSMKASLLGNWMGVSYDEQSHAFELLRSNWGSALAEMTVVPVANSVDAIASRVGSMDWEIRRDADDGVIDDSERRGKKQTKLGRFIDQCYREKQVPLFEHWERALQVTGEAYIYLRCNLFGYIDALEWLNPLAIYKHAPFDQVEYYRYLGALRQKNIPLDKMVYDRLPRLVSDVDGFSPVEVAIREVNNDSDVQRTMRASFKNHAMPGGMFVPKDPTMQVISDEMESRIMKALMRDHKGVDNRYRLGFMGMAMDFHQFAPPNMADFVPIMKAVENRVYAAFRVSRVVMGATDDQRYQANPQEVDWFMQQRIVPIVKKRADLVNGKIIPAIEPDGGYYLKFKTEQYERATKEEIEIASTKLQSGAITINEYRESIGLEALPNGDLFMMPIGVSLVPKNELGAAPAPPSPDDNGGEPMLLVEPGSNEPPRLTLDLNKASQLPAPQLSTGEQKAADNSGFAGIQFGADEQLITQQNAVKAAYESIDGITYNDPATFHLTLVYAEDMVQLALEDTYLETFDEFNVTVSGFGIFDPPEGFDAPEGRALYLKVDKSENLAMLQKNVHDKFNGASLSDFSQPDDWQPHITLAYLPNGTEEVALELEPFGLDVREVIYSQGEEGDAPDHRVNGKAVQVILKPTAPPIEKSHQADCQCLSCVRTETSAIDMPDNVLYAPEDVIESAYATELQTWRKFALDRLDKPNKRHFHTEVLPFYVEHSIRRGLEQATDRKAIHQLFDTPYAASKSQASYRRRIREAARGFWNSNLNANEFLTTMHSAIENEFPKGLAEGLKKEGLTLDEISPNEQAMLDTEISEEKAHVAELLLWIGEARGNNTLLKEVRGRIDRWVTRYDSIVALGELMGAKDKKKVWRLGATDVHCVDCKQLANRVYRASTWLKHMLKPRGRNLNCLGIHCQCYFDDTDEPLTRGRPPKLVGPG